MYDQSPCLLSKYISLQTFQHIMSRLCTWLLQPLVKPNRLLRMPYWVLSDRVQWHRMQCVPRWKIFQSSWQVTISSFFRYTIHNLYLLVHNAVLLTHVQIAERARTTFYLVKLNALNVLSTRSIRTREAGIQPAIRVLLTMHLLLVAPCVVLLGNMYPFHKHPLVNRVQSIHMDLLKEFVLIGKLSIEQFVQYIHNLLVNVH